MGFDDVCNTNLVLGLGLSSSRAERPRKKVDDEKGVVVFEASLTLSLAGESNFDKIGNTKEDGILVNNNDNLCRQDSGAASSFSNVSMKREREAVSDEAEMMTTMTERVFSRGSDEDEDASNGRKKLRLTKAQSAFLEESFKQHTTLNPKQKLDLARELNLRPRQVEVWFQNRRARTKLKQTEVDCEFLKKCCETLTDENRKLQKELQELKALKVAQPFYMQLPAATLTMCPSCERIGGGGSGNSSTKPFNSIPPNKPNFYNPFTNPSAAC